MVQAKYPTELNSSAPKMQPVKAAHTKSHSTDDMESQSIPTARAADDSLEKYEMQDAEDQKPQPAIKGLGWLDRLLALWILLAMVVGILLGNFVDGVGPALHRGEFVGVSIPIGKWSPYDCLECQILTASSSRRTPGHDVSHPMQSQIRDPASCLPIKRVVDTSRLQHRPELDRCPPFHGEQ